MEEDKKIEDIEIGEALNTSDSSTSSSDSTIGFSDGCRGKGKDGDELGCALGSFLHLEHLLDASEMKLPSILAIPKKKFISPLPWNSENANVDFFKGCLLPRQIPFKLKSTTKNLKLCRLAINPMGFKGKLPLDPKKKYELMTSKADVNFQLEISNHVDTVKIFVPRLTRSLHSAVTLSELQSIKDVLGKGADINGRDCRLRTALHLAIPRGNEDVIALLLEKGADPNNKDIVGNTPLHLAVYSTKLIIPKMLLDAGASPFLRDNMGKSAWMLAQMRYKNCKRFGFHPNLASMVAMFASRVNVKMTGLIEQMDKNLTLSDEKEKELSKEIDTITDVMNQFESMYLGEK